MPNCPKCNAHIVKLDLTETKEDCFEVEYDPESEDLEYTDAQGEWFGNSLETIIKQQYACPECKGTIATSEEQAREFLKQDFPEGTIVADD
jgi:uncharacterized protein YbaR (Trm112 family)